MQIDGSSNQKRVVLNKVKTSMWLVTPILMFY